MDCEPFIGDGLMAVGAELVHETRLRERRRGGCNVHEPIMDRRAMAGATVTCRREDGAVQGIILHSENGDEGPGSTGVQSRRSWLDRRNQACQSSGTEHPNAKG